MSRKSQSVTLPIGFADQLLELEMRLQDEESLEIIQILSQLYKIGVDYYLENDLKKAGYMQKKLNSLIVRSLHAHSIEQPQLARDKLHKKVREQIDKFNEYENTYLKTIVNQSQKSQKRIQDCVLADLNRQEQSLQSRMLKRIKSSGKL